MLAPSKTNIYRLGCAGNGVPPYGPPSENLVQNGDMELVQQAGTDGCVMHRMGCLPNWVTTPSNDQGAWTDDRAWVSISTTAPHSGRHAARLQLPTEDKAMVLLPINSYKTADLCLAAGLTKKQPCANIMNSTRYSLRLAARATTMGAALGGQMEAAVLLGAYLPSADKTSAPTFAGTTLKTAQLDRDWSVYACPLPSRVLPVHC
eukprot:COSAG04_NODE_4367_length_2135_cov_276.332515_1_plen_205_part_00